MQGQPGLRTFKVKAHNCFSKTKKSVIEETTIVTLAANKRQNIYFNVDDKDRITAVVVSKFEGNIKIFSEINEL